MKSTCLFLAGISASLPLAALELNSELGLEATRFLQSGLNGQSRNDLSLRLEPELLHEWHERADSLVFTGFVRLDQEDARRTHADIRELYWQHVGDNWDLRLGIDKVFWGVTESLHLVDVINQTDLVENVDTEDKLGQPMLHFSWFNDWGTLEAFWLPYFRERTFPSEEGRFRTPVAIDHDDAQFSASAARHHQDFAIRFSKTLSAIELSLAHFSGTSREPIFRFNGDLAAPRLIPHYQLIKQTSLTLQTVQGGWLWKLEALAAAGAADRYLAAVSGFEYTQVGVFASDTDLGWVLEYLYDDRTDPTLAPFERDWFLGSRWTLNDVQSTSALFGVIWDPVSDERFYSLELSRRLTDQLSLSFESRLIAGGERLPKDLPGLLQQLAAPSSNNKLGLLRRDDYLRAELTWFF